jgi:hypothetical protein
MKFLMLVATDPDRPDNPDPTGTQPVDEWVEQNDAAGIRVLGERLRPAAEARVVRRREGSLLVTEGPFAETHEWIVGFDVLECTDLDEAVKIASRHPMAAAGRLELRAFWE